jgi:hypothetical protein
MSHQSDQLLHLDVQAFMSHNVSPVAGAVAMDLLLHVWWPTKEPFAFNSSTHAAFLNARAPGRKYTAEMLQSNHAEIASFFTELPDGRWAPSPKYVSMTSVNPGQAS